MADFIRESVDVKAKASEVYAFAEDPKLGQLMAPAREVSDVQSIGDGRVKLFKTKTGTVKYTLHQFPQRWEAVYQRPDMRVRVDARFEAHGEALTRLMVDINLQPQSFAGRLKAPMARRGFRQHLLQRLAAIQQQFNKK